MLYATVRNRKIHVKRPDTVVQNGVNVDWLQLDMDDEWQSMDSIVCVFMLHYTEESTSTQESSVTTTITEKEVQKEMLHTFGEPVMVPWECLEHTGMLSVNCTGYVRDEDGESQKVMTTAYPDSYWEVVQNGPMSGEETLEPTPSLYDQIVAAAGAATAAAADAEKARNQLLQDKANGVFDGKDGESTRVTVGNTVTGPPGTSANVYQTGDDNNCVLNFTIPRGDPGPVPSALPNPYPLSLNIEGVQIDYDGSRAVAAQIAPKVDDVGTAIMLQIRNHNESPTAHEDIREAIPEQLPNPYALSLNINGVPVEYDGSQPVVANIETTGNAGGVGSEDVTRAISAHNDDADAHPEIRDMIPIVPGTLPNPFSLTINYANEDGGMLSVSYAGDRFVSVSAEELTAYPIAQHNQSGEAHQDIRDAIPTVPNALPNPNKLTFTGAVEAEYDGSEAVSVEIPAGGGADLSLGVTGAAVGQAVKITAVDENGKPTAWEPVDMSAGGGVATVNGVGPDEDGNVYADSNYKQCVTLVSDTLTEETAGLKNYEYEIEGHQMDDLLLVKLSYPEKITMILYVRDQNNNDITMEAPGSAVATLFAIKIANGRYLHAAVHTANTAARLDLPMSLFYGQLNGASGFERPKARGPITRLKLVSTTALAAGTTITIMRM